MSFKTVQPGDPAWLKDAFAHLGLAEIDGPGSNETILAMFEASGHPEVRDDATSWCAAFVNWIAEKNGMADTGELTAQSFLKWGSKATKARRGDVVVIKRGTKSWQGHVFFWLAEDGDYIWGIGGNQGKGGAVTVSRFPKAKLMGIRRPPAAADAPVPKPRPEFPDYPEELVLAIQTALWDKGYKQVGLRDGDYGTDTRTAIQAFETDNHLAETGVPTGEILAAILASEPRVLAPERTGASPAEVREQVPEAKASWFAKVGSFWGMIAAGVAAAFNWITETFKGLFGHFGSARELVRPIVEIAGDIPPWAYALVVAGGMLWLYLQSRRAVAISDAAFKTGERR